MTVIAKEDQKNGLTLLYKNVMAFGNHYGNFLVETPLDRYVTHRLV